MVAREQERVPVEQAGAARGVAGSGDEDEVVGSQPKRRRKAAWSATSSRWLSTIVETPPRSSSALSSGPAARGESMSTLPAGRWMK